jgi:pimeloyl-ACP methyl ester carboxylesterase
VTSSWTTLRPTLAGRHRTFSLESRGHGRSDNPADRLSYAQMADDVAAFIEQKELAPAHVAGFSDGATIGLALGMTRPKLLRSLVAVGASYRIDDVLGGFLGFFDAETIEREDPEYAAEFARRHDSHHHPGYWRKLVRQVRENIEREMVWTEDDLRRIPVPTLIISGEADFTLSLQQVLEMRRSIPRSELLLVNQAGMEGMAHHRVHATRPEVVGPAMLEFLERHSGATVEVGVATVGGATSEAMGNRQ